MFDIGFLELLIIGVVGLLVLGPERLPKAARTAGLWIGRIKRSVAGMQREISAQLEAEDRFVQARLETAASRVALYKALGGGWDSADTSTETAAR